MYEDEWNRFMQTGQVLDYLNYKEREHRDDAGNGAGETNERGDAGFRNSYGDYIKIRADW
ncbi:MAG: hypothetical protein LUE96_08145 [Lachnospiraceae bacterium]|nr:hypothetical protein [Lachnospiraceae bacterium]